MRYSKLYTRWLQIAVILISAACSKMPCDTSNTPITSIVGPQFRLYTTTNPSILLNNYNSLVFQFKNDFTGTLWRLSNNRLYIVANLVWNINSDKKLMRIQYTPVSGGDTGGTTGGGSDPQTVDYNLTYTGTRIKLTEVQSPNYQYSLGNYSGVVDPGKANQCTFQD